MKTTSPLLVRHPGGTRRHILEFSFPLLGFGWLLLSILFSSAAFAQAPPVPVPLVSQPTDSLRRLSGTVLDSLNGPPVAGAIVTVVGTGVGVLTDAQGRFQLLLAPRQRVLEISALGFGPYRPTLPAGLFESDPVFLLRPQRTALRDSVLVSAYSRVPARDTFHTVQVYFATDRTRGPLVKAVQTFETGRGPMRYGTAQISIPGLHKAGSGQIERPYPGFPEDPYRHVMLLKTAPLQATAFFAAIRTGVANRAAFVFVHGYNVSFAEAARRTAQLHFDLGFAGVPTFFSWPSQGGITPYVVDEQNAEWAQDDFKAFMQAYLTATGTRPVYIIAHSMGNRLVTRALKELVTEQPTLAGRIKELVLAAPDLDADVFRTNIAPALTRSKIPITLYTSPRDRALQASRLVHGRYNRLGLADPPPPVRLAGIETVVAPESDDSFSDQFGLGHSYFGDVPLVLQDLRALLVKGQRAGQRPRLRPVTVPGSLPYWQL